MGCHQVAVVQYTFTHKQYIEQHMFRAVPLPIIRSFTLYIDTGICHAGVKTAFKHD